MFFGFGMAGLGFWTGYLSGKDAGYSQGWSASEAKAEKLRDREEQKNERRAKGVGEFLPPEEPSPGEMDQYAKQLGVELSAGPLPKHKP